MEGSSGEGNSFTNLFKLRTRSSRRPDDAYAPSGSHTSRPAPRVDHESDSGARSVRLHRQRSSLRAGGSSYGEGDHSGYEEGDGTVDLLSNLQREPSVEVYQWNEETPVEQHVPVREGKHRSAAGGSGRARTRRGRQHEEHSETQHYSEQVEDYSHYQHGHGTYDEANNLIYGHHPQQYGEAQYPYGQLGGNEQYVPSNMEQLSAQYSQNMNIGSSSRTAKFPRVKKRHGMYHDPAHVAYASQIAPPTILESTQVADQHQQDMVEPPPFYVEEEAPQQEVYQANDYEYTLQVDPALHLANYNGLVFDFLDEFQHMIIIEQVRQIRAYKVDTIRQGLLARMKGPEAVAMLGKDVNKIEDAVYSIFPDIYSRKWMEGFDNAYRRQVIDLLAAATGQATDLLRDGFITAGVTPVVAAGVLDAPTPEARREYAERKGLIFDRWSRQANWRKGLNNVQREALLQRACNLREPPYDREYMRRVLTRSDLEPGSGMMMLRATDASFKSMIEGMTNKYLP
ncbi:hypothetical protein CBS101457_000185 [Exobasidium rhododendri]|nr:hypothetical protein CBS101457_000185 [Exobasidium rhododendri]